MKNEENRSESPINRNDFLVELNGLSKEFRGLGGNPDFLLYALTGALLTEPPEKGIAEINAILTDVINPKQLAALGRDAQKMIERLGKLSGYNSQRDVVLQAADALQKLVDWIAVDEIELLSRSAGHQIGAKVWRYPFYAAVWPYLRTVSTSKEDTKLDWLQQMFDFGDAIKVLDQEFVRKSLGVGGLKPKDLMKPAFEISKLKSRGNADTARAWAIKARGTTDPALHSYISGATDDFLVWHHKLFGKVDRDRRPVKFTKQDLVYAEKAWAMLRDDFGHTQLLSPPAVLLARCLGSAHQ